MSDEFQKGDLLPNDGRFGFANPPLEYMGKSTTASSAPYFGTPEITDHTHFKISPILGWFGTDDDFGGHLFMALGAFWERDGGWGHKTIKRFGVVVLGYQIGAKVTIWHKTPKDADRGKYYELGKIDK